MGHPKSSLFVIGDSISIGYGPYLNTFLGNDFAYDRKRDDEPNIPDHLNGENSEDSNKVLGYLQARLDAGGFRPDLLLVNCGLHDLRRHADSDIFQVLPEQYEQNLDTIVALVQEHGLSLIWARTTPVDDHRHNTLMPEFRRFDDDVKRYNALADQIMAASSVPIIDLYLFVQTLGADVYADHVHFHPEFTRLQGAYIAGFIQGLQR